MEIKEVELMKTNISLKPRWMNFWKINSFFLKPASSFFPCQKVCQCPRAKKTLLRYHSKEKEVNVLVNDLVFDMVDSDYIEEFRRWLSPIIHLKSLIWEKIHLIKIIIIARLEILW